MNKFKNQEEMMELLQRMSKTCYRCSCHKMHCSTVCCDNSEIADLCLKMMIRESPHMKTAFTLLRESCELCLSECKKHTGEEMSHCGCPEVTSKMLKMIPST